MKVISATITFPNIQETTTSFSFQNETPKTIYKVIKNEEASCCQNEQDLVDYRKWATGVAAVVIKGITRSLDDLSSLKGALWDEAKSIIPKDWISGPMKKGEGMKFVNPAKKVRSESLPMAKYTPENIMSINHKNLQDPYPQNYKKIVQQSNM